MEAPTPEHRLIAAMAASIEEKGYRDTTVADVVRIARTSRRTFYEHFADREACFLALFRATVEQTMARIAGAVRPEDPWERQVDCAIEAYIDGVSAQPALQKSFVRELPALGAAGAEQQRQVIEGYARTLVALVEAGRRAQPDSGVGPLPFDVAVIIVGGLRELLIIAVQQGRAPSEMKGAAAGVVKAILAGLR
jgi:AcrR family transcriptional regulator